MTEYDYSPGAYEKFIEKQRKVGQWAEEQARLAEAQRYGNPFIPSASGHDHDDHRRPRGFSRSRSTPLENQFYESPSRHIRHGSGSHHHPQHHQQYQHRNNHYDLASGSGSYAYGSHSLAHASTPTLVNPQLMNNDGRSRSHSHSRSRSHSRPDSSSRSRTRPPPSRSHTSSYATNHLYSASQGHLLYDSPRHPHDRDRDRDRDTPATRSTYSPVHYAAPGEPLIMQQGKHTLVVVPSHGTRVEVMVRPFSLLAPSIILYSPSMLAFKQPCISMTLTDLLSPSSLRSLRVVQTPRLPIVTLAGKTTLQWFLPLPRNLRSSRESSTSALVPPTDLVPEMPPCIGPASLDVW